MGVGISGAGLAGSVAKCGAVGTIASVGLCHNSPLFSVSKHNYFEANAIVIKETLAKARELAGADGVLAVNCMVALIDYDTQVRAAAEGGRTSSSPAQACPSGCRITRRTFRTSPSSPSSVPPRPQA